jgi:hypothetical protein
MKTMKVFISWFGTRSKKIAICLKKYLSMMFHNINFFVSETDIETGDLWRKTLAEKLRESNFGIICLTKEIISNPWILFEAGSLAKEDESRVIPLCFGFSHSDIPPKNPLSAFQGKNYEKESMKSIFISLNEKVNREMDAATLDSLFNYIFKELDHDVKDCLTLSYDDIDKTKNITKTFDEIIYGFEKSDAPRILISWLYWGRKISKIVRKNQTYDFIMEDTTLKKDGSPAVKITGKHIYTVVNESSSEYLNLPTQMISELGLQSSEDGWGFESLYFTEEGGERRKHSADLINTTDKLRKELGLEFIIPPQKSIKLEYMSFGVFLPSDKYIWYSQEFCENCKISVINKTTIVDSPRFKINHRDERLIQNGIEHNGNEHKINFNKEIFPREGFTMYWKEKSKDTSEV